MKSRWLSELVTVAFVLSFFAAPAALAQPFDLFFELLFYGEVTQAPPGNPLNALLGESVQGSLTFQHTADSLGGFPTIPLTINTFYATFDIGTATYTDQFTGGSDTTTGNFLAFNGGVLTDLLVQFPLHTITVPPFLLPGLTLEGQFFYTEINPTIGTENPCAEGAVCGTLTLGEAPRIVTVPEPATLALLGIGLAGLGFSRRRKLN